MDKKYEIYISYNIHIYVYGYIYIYAVEHCSVIKIKILPFATRMEEKGIAHGETSETKTNIVCFL